MIYTEAGEFEEYRSSENPDMVVMDTAIIAKAPVRLLVSGMGDALHSSRPKPATMRAPPAWPEDSPPRRR